MRFAWKVVGLEFEIWQAFPKLKTKIPIQPQYKQAETVANSHAYRSKQASGYVSKTMLQFHPWILSAFLCLCNLM